MSKRDPWLFLFFGMLVVALILSLAPESIAGECP